MFLLLASNPTHPMDANIIDTKVTNLVKKISRYFSTIKPIITERNIVTLRNNQVNGKFKGTQEGSKKIGYYVFYTSSYHFFRSDRKTVPSRIIAKLKGVKRLWTLKGIDERENLIYTSIVGDKLILATE